MLKRTKITALMLIALAFLMTVLEARASLSGSKDFPNGTMSVCGVRSINPQTGLQPSDTIDYLEILSGVTRMAQGYGRRRGASRRNPYPANRPGRYRDLPPPTMRAPNRAIRGRPYRFRDNPPPRRNPYRSVGPNRQDRFRNLISPSHAINLARARVNGKLLGIRRANRYGITVYVIKFRTTSRVREVIVDASSGSVLN